MGDKLNHVDTVPVSRGHDSEFGQFAIIFVFAAFLALVITKLSNLPRWLCAAYV